jgi:hypothetical protein
LEYTTYASRLRYLDADDVNDPAIEYDGMEVRGPEGDKLGDLDGFIVDAEAGRVYYVVVDAGGWFSSRRLLLPIGHATLDGPSRTLNVDVGRDALTRYPEFQEDRFRQFSDEDLRQFESRMVTACCPGEDVDDVSVRSWAYDTRRHYKQPGWWGSGIYTRERLSPVDPPAGRTTRAPATMSSQPTGVGVAHEHVTAREHVNDRPEPGRSETSRAGEAGPHFDGRAQPGDVLGIETGGERTKIGDTADDEDKRRRDAERR